MMPGIIDRFRKRRAVRAFIRRLGPELHARFGHASHYSADQIQSLVESKSFRRHRDFLVYAYCLFMSRDDFEAMDIDMGRMPDYSSLQVEAYGLVGPGASASAPVSGAYGDSFHDGFHGDAGGGDGGIGV